MGVGSQYHIYNLYEFLFVFGYILYLYFGLFLAQKYISGKRCVSLCESAFSNLNGRKNRQKKTHTFPCKKIGVQMLVYFYVNFHGSK